MIGWGVSASILVHCILALLLIFGFPLTLPAEPKDDSVSVEIVDPPEEEKPEAEKQAEGTKPEEKTPPAGKKEGEEARPPEKQARMTPAQTQQAEDESDPTSGATPPGEVSQAFESVPEDAAQEKDEAAPDETATTRTEDKPTTAKAKAAEVSQRQLSKADLDAVKEAMRQAAETEKAAEQAKAEARKAEQAKADAQKADQAKAEAAAILAARQAAETAEAAAEIAKASVPDKAEAETPVETATAIGPEKAASQTGDAAAATEIMPDDAAFSQAKELFSKQSLRDPRVKKALGKLPPNRRLVQICTIEALEQVRHASPDALPEGMVPFAERGGLIAGPKLAASGGAYFSQGKWYGIDFSCETNADVTEITAFRYDMTGAIPRGEWKSRKLPAP